MKRQYLGPPAAVVALVAAWLAAAFTPPAHAYIDAGSGMLVLQMIGALFAGGLIVFRKAVGHFFRRLLGKPISEEKDEGEGSDDA
jgi:hypothetical protein